MTEENGTPPPEGTPPADGAPSITLTPEQETVLKEHGIEVPADGKIAVTDHVKLLNALSSLKGQVKQTEAEKEQARLAALSETDRRIEEARAEARAEADRAAAEKVAAARVKAEAVRLNFNDPGDVFAMIPDASSLDAEEAIAAAVEKLAADKPYLIKKAAGGSSLEQGPRGGTGPTSTADGWLRKELTR